MKRQLMHLFKVFWPPSGSSVLTTAVLTPHILPWASQVLVLISSAPSSMLGIFWSVTHTHLHTHLHTHIRTCKVNTVLTGFWWYQIFIELICAIGECESWKCKANAMNWALQLSRWGKMLFLSGYRQTDEFKIELHYLVMSDIKADELYKLMWLEIILLSITICMSFPSLSLDYMKWLKKCLKFNWTINSLFKYPMLCTTNSSLSFVIWNMLSLASNQTLLFMIPVVKIFCNFLHLPP